MHTKFNRRAICSVSPNYLDSYSISKKAHEQYIRKKHESRNILFFASLLQNAKKVYKEYKMFGVWYALPSNANLEKYKGFELR